MAFCSFEGYALNLYVFFKMTIFITLLKINISFVAAFAFTPPLNEVGFHAMIL